MTAPRRRPPSIGRSGPTCNRAGPGPGSRGPRIARRCRKWPRGLPAAPQPCTTRRRGIPPSGLGKASGAWCHQPAVAVALREKLLSLDRFPMNPFQQGGRPLAGEMAPSAPRPSYLGYNRQPGGNMNSIVLTLTAFLVCAAAATAAGPNTLTGKEKAEGCKSLFDGHRPRT
jgi:hypothetical protein